jgi:hypothetical protein
MQADDIETHVFVYSLKNAEQVRQAKERVRSINRLRDEEYSEVVRSSSEYGHVMLRVNQLLIEFAAVIDEGLDAIVCRQTTTPVGGDRRGL